MIKKIRCIINETGYLSLGKRMIVRIRRQSRDFFHSLRDTLMGTYVEGLVPPHICLTMDKTVLLGLKNTLPDAVIDHYLSHRFDLLGSGWVKVHYGMQCRGLEQYRFDMSKPITQDKEGAWLRKRLNRSNARKARVVWQAISSDYQAIDWQMDFKSGFRWSEKTWSKHIRFGHQLGVDVKVPWELARMQHLPQLAIAFSTEGDLLKKQRLLKAYENQVLDFIATNPPAYGVNWVCPMDIAIRAANWLLAYEVFAHAGAQFMPSFVSHFTHAIYAHGAYIVENLEWSDKRANHYLANICGLIFIASGLPSLPITDTWLAFSIQELIIEVRRQFEEDGGHFEGSTAYHRLSAEMVYYATARLVSLPAERLEKLKNHQATLLKNKCARLRYKPLVFYSLAEKGLKLFPVDYWQQLERMGLFIGDITKPSGQIPQIGDNDSGRFCKLTPRYEVLSMEAARQIYWHLESYQGHCNESHYFLEEHLDCQHVLAALNAFLKKPAVSLGLNGYNDGIVIQALTSQQTIPQINRAKDLDPVTALFVSQEQVLDETIAYCQTSTDLQTHKTAFTVKTGDLLAELNVKVYPQFGIYLFTSPRLYLSIRCYLGASNTMASHRHYDQLSIELSIDGEDIITDPGTYLYTPLPVARRYYQGALNHFSPFSDEESANQETSYHLFADIKLPKVNITYFGPRGFVAQTTAGDSKRMLMVELSKQSILIYHVLPANKRYQCFKEKDTCFSPAYGIKRKGVRDYELHSSRV